MLKLPGSVTQDINTLLGSVNSARLDKTSVHSAQLIRSHGRHFETDDS